MTFCTFHSTAVVMALVSQVWVLMEQLWTQCLEHEYVQSEYNSRARIWSSVMHAVTIALESRMYWVWGSGHSSPIVGNGGFFLEARPSSPSQGGVGGSEGEMVVACVSDKSCWCPWWRRLLGLCGWILHCESCKESMAVTGAVGVLYGKYSCGPCRGDRWGPMVASIVFFAPCHLWMSWLRWSP